MGKKGEVYTNDCRFHKFLLGCFHTYTILLKLSGFAVWPKSKWEEWSLPWTVVWTKQTNVGATKRGALSQDQAGSRFWKVQCFVPMTGLPRKDKGQLLSKQNELRKHIKMPRFFSCFSWRGIRVMRQQYGRTVPPETKDNVADKQAMKQAIFNALMSDANKPINVKYRDMRPRYLTTIWCN